MSVAESTAGSYVIAWRRLKVYIHAYTETTARISANDEDYLGRELSIGQLSCLIMEFGQYLFEDLDLGAERVSWMLSALRFCFTCRGGELEAFRTLHLKAFRAGLSKQPLPVDWQSGSRLPTPLDMAHRIHTNMGSKPGWRERACAVGIVLAYCCLLRPSEYLTKTSSDKHVLRAKLVEFMRGGRFIGAHNLHRYNVQWSEVTMVRIQFNSAKNFNERAGRSIWFTAHVANSTLELP
jgi:hypothetical protein